jgi:hypothetical protein
MTPHTHHGRRSHLPNPCAATAAGIAPSNHRNGLAALAALFGQAHRQHAIFETGVNLLGIDMARQEWR